ncbi:MAG: ATP phosphoribosyltransferase [Patescibacteria group bacterium]
MKNTIKIAIQKKGRLNEPSLVFLSAIGINNQQNGHCYITICKKTNTEIILVRDDDIPEYVSQGVVDFGIVGENVLAEKGIYTNIIRRLGFGNCQLVIAAPKDSLIKTTADLEGKRIATSYPQLLSKYLRINNINAAIVNLDGSVEIAPSLNLADAICDITQTGQTLKENGLIPIETIVKSEAVLIESPFENSNKQKFLNLI